MDSKQQQLMGAYRQTLSDLPLYWLDRSREQEADFKHLSGLFLPGTSPEYEQAAIRIMVVGRETRRWDVLTSGKPFIDLDDYIQGSSAHIRQRFFPHKGELSVCSEPGDYRMPGISVNQLWRFRLHVQWHSAPEQYQYQFTRSTSLSSRPDTPW